MRLLHLVPLALVSSASASALIPRAVAAASLIVSRQTSVDCTKACTPVINAQDACGNNNACACVASFAKKLYACAECEAKADPTSVDQVQNSLNEYTSGCQAIGKPVGTLTLSELASATGSATSSSAVSTPALTSSTTTPPAFASSTSSVVAASTSSAAVSAASTTSVAAASSASTAPASTTSAGSNGASSLGNQRTGALVAAGIAAAFVVM
ncbi:hypothetical protein FRB90_006158 [Tulasnella sp. 427]|nr:hypothetical protein FRB90_006158 [Tulasnella sp. 427]